MGWGSARVLCVMLLYCLYVGVLELRGNLGSACSTGDTFKIPNVTMTYLCADLLVPIRSNMRSNIVPLPLQGYCAGCGESCPNHRDLLNQLTGIYLRTAYDRSRIPVM